MLFLYALNLQAQFTDDMESYTDGEPINEAHWTDAGCGGFEGYGLIATSAKPHEGLFIRICFRRWNYPSSIGFR